MLLYSLYMFVYIVFIFISHEWSMSQLDVKGYLTSKWWWVTILVKSPFPQHQMFKQFSKPPSSQPENHHILWLHWENSHFFAFQMDISCPNVRPRPSPSVATSVATSAACATEGATVSCWGCPSQTWSSVLAWTSCASWRPQKHWRATGEQNIIVIGQCVKTLVPSEPQNSWDLWMFIPLKMVLIGIDP